MHFAKRMTQFEEGIFTKLLEIKNRKIAQKENIIDLSVGTPNIPPAQHIIDALCDSAKNASNYVYAINDQSTLLEAVAMWYKNRYEVELDAKTEICSLLGSQEGLAHISLTIVDEGDIVLVPDPCYPVFADGPMLAGAELYYMSQKAEHNYMIQLDQIPEEIARRAKLMIVSYPNNPTTALAPDFFYEELIAYAKKHNIIVLHDNAYSELVYDGRKCGSFLRFPGAVDIGIEFNSLSKTYGLAGARVGFCVGNREIIKQLKRLKSNMDYGMFMPVQEAAIAAITGDQSCVEITRCAYERRRDILCDGLLSIGWQLKKPEATMFVWAKIPGHYTKSEEFVMDLLEQSGVMVTPGSAFGPSGEGYVRLALVQDEELLKETVSLIEKAGILRGKV